MAYTGQYETFPNVKANSTGLATSQFTVVKLASTAGIVVASGVLNSTTALTLGPLGILMNKPAGGEEAEVAWGGIAKLLVATSTIIIGDHIGVNSTSQGTEAARTDNTSFIAVALQASAAANDIITVLLNGGSNIQRT
jgi:hypothetical protein